jgi:hypothetical protein
MTLTPLLFPLPRSLRSRGIIIILIPLLGTGHPGGAAVPFGLRLIFDRLPTTRRRLFGLIGDGRISEVFLE